MNELPANWITMNIGEFAQRIKRKNNNQICNNILTISAKDGLISQKEYFKKSVASKDTSRYTLLENGEFAYNKSYSDGFPVGAARRLTRYPDGIVSPLYICFSVDQKLLNLKYADYLFNSQWFNSAIFSIAKEGARSHGLLNLGINEFFDVSLPIPPLPEQKKIAEILSEIDKKSNSIQLYIDSIDFLYQSMLIDVINRSSNNSCNYKLSDACSDVFLGLTSKVDYVEKNGIPLVRATNIKNGNIDFTTTRQISIQQHHTLTKYRQAEAGDILVTKSGSLGECAVVKEAKEFSIYESIVCLKPTKDLVSTQYLYHVMKSDFVKYQFTKGKVGSAVVHLNLNDFRQIIIPIPSLDSQGKISNALDSISRTKDKLELKLNKIKSLRSAMSADLLLGRTRVNV